MCGGMCKGMCGGGHGHHALVWVIKIVILVVIFWLGVKIGEIKGALEGGYFRGSRMMMQYGYDGNDANYAPMMYGRYSQDGTSQTATSTPVKTKLGK